MNQIIPQVSAPAQFLSTGLQMEPGMSYPEWLNLGETLQGIEKSIMWWLGDWVRFGEAAWGETYTQGIEASGYSYQTVADAKWVASRYEFSRRRENLSFSHHKEVASLPPEQADSALDVAEREGMSRNDFRAWLKGGNYRTITTGENEWYTPSEYVEMARTVLGGIDLDPASCAEANKVVQATKFYTSDDDGLAQKWHGNVWLNPPYSRDLMPAFVEKLCVEYEMARIRAAVMVSHNNTDTGWFHRIAPISGGICFPKRRIKFYRGEDIAGPVNGQAFVYLGANSGAFAEVFRKIGVVMVPA